MAPVAPNQGAAEVADRASAGDVRQTAIRDTEVSLIIVDQ